MKIGDLKCVTYICRGEKVYAKSISGHGVFITLQGMRTFYVTTLSGRWMMSEYDESPSWIKVSKRQRIPNKREIKFRTLYDLRSWLKKWEWMFNDPMSWQKVPSGDTVVIFPFPKKKKRSNKGNPSLGVFP